MLLLLLWLGLKVSSDILVIGEGDFFSRHFSTLNIFISYTNHKKSSISLKIFFVLFCFSLVILSELLYFFYYITCSLQFAIDEKSFTTVQSPNNDWSVLRCGDTSATKYFHVHTSSRTSVEWLSSLLNLSHTQNPSRL